MNNINKAIRQFFTVFHEMFGKRESRVKYPMRLIIFASVFTLIILPISFYLSWDSYKNVKEEIKKTIHISELIGSILHYDEVLTMSAYMASTTGDVFWEERYYKYASERDTILKQLIVIDQESFTGKSTDKIDVASIKLEKIEVQVFKSVNVGDLGKAKELLASKTYKREKAIYKKGLLEINENHKLESEKPIKQVYSYLWFLIATSFLTIITWLVSYHKYNTLINSNQVLTATEQQLRATIQQLTATEQQLLAANQQMEAKNLQLIASERKFSAFMDDFPGSVYIKDENLNLIYANKFSEKFHIKNWKGKHPSELFSPEIAKQVISSDKKALREGSMRYEEELPYKNGDLRHLLANKFSFTLPNNKKCIGGFSIDVTKHKIAEDALKESEKNLRMVFDAAQNVAFIRTDLNGAKTKIVEFSPGAENMFDYSREEIIGKSISILHTPENIKRYPDMIKTVGTNKNGYSGEVDVVRKSGELFPIFFTLYPIFDKNNILCGTLGVSVDATELKKTEKALKESETMLRQVIDLVPHFIFAKDEDSKFLIANKAIADFYGIPMDEVIGKSVMDLVANKEEAKKFMSDDKEVIRSGKRKYLDEQITDSKGNISFLETIKIPFETILTEKRAILGAAVDITERKLAEMALIRAKEKAEESDRLKTAFLSNISHEIRTPMNGILGFTYLLKNSQLTGTEKEEYIKIIEVSGNRLLNTINDIVDISRIEAGQVRVEKDKVSVNKILEEHFVVFNSEAKEKGLVLNYKPSLPDNAANIITDKHKLQGILTNLIKNAIKFTEQGIVSFGCDIKKENDFDVLEFYVKDTGVGIPADRIEAVFNRFEQADIEDTRVFEGSGLGLSISMSYVEMLDGKIRVSSKEGLGSTFVFSIPYVAQISNEII